MEARFEELRNRLAQIVDLGRAARLLSWDQQTMMPRNGAPARAEQLATLGRLAHEQLIADEMGHLLEELAPYVAGHPVESLEASLVRVVGRDYEKARRVPPELAAEITRAASLAQPVWVEARAESDFARFLPYLRRNVELKREYIACFDFDGEPYDVLLDDYEEGTTAAEVRGVFDRLKERLVPLIGAVSTRADAVDESVLAGPFPIERQKDVVRTVLERFGFDDAGWRIDLTAHPFATNTSTGDVRLTTRYSEDHLGGLFGAMHEFGHGLYEHGSDQALERTPLAGGVSLGLHESQSRLWENLVGRSRPFWGWFFPELQSAFPSVLGEVDVDSFHRAVNRVQPSLIRVEADQVTYGLHVILRFELEQEIIGEQLELADLPEAWDVRMREYLGVDVPNDGLGVLQDIHWAHGIFGYFPTYALGTVMSVQIWEAARRELPDLDAQIGAGEFRALRDWLRERLHRLGRTYTPKETLVRVAGGPIDPEPYLRYLDGLAEELYGISPASVA